MARHKISSAVDVVDTDICPTKNRLYGTPDLIAIASPQRCDACLRSNGSLSFFITRQKFLLDQHIAGRLCALCDIELTERRVAFYIGAGFFRIEVALEVRRMNLSKTTPNVVAVARASANR